MKSPSPHLGLLLVLGCADANLVECSRELVAPETYFEAPECWTSSQEEFSAIMILVETPAGKIPYLLSQKCQLVGDHANEELDLYEYRSPIAVYGDGAEQISRLTNLKGQVTLNTRSNLPMPQASDKAYAVRIRVEKDAARGYGLRLADTLELRPIQMSFREILEIRRNCTNT